MWQARVMSGYFGAAASLLCVLEQSRTGWKAAAGLQQQGLMPAAWWVLPAGLQE